MANNVLYYSPSPHVKTSNTTRKIMLHVIIALSPATIMGVIYFGLYALLLIALAVISAVAAEFIYLIIAKKPINEIAADFDFSSVVTGLLIGLTIGTNYPAYVPVLGSFFSIIVVKMLFGGTGKNVVNPAIAGRIFIFISFQTVVGAWINPSVNPISAAPLSTGATTLVNLLENGVFPSLSNWDLFFGTGLTGCIGETCKAAILVGGLYLAVVKVIDIKLPVIYVAVSGLFSVALNGFDFTYFLPFVLTGGLTFGAFFMATDYVTTPNTKLGNVIYFIALGLLTAGLRAATHMETVSFAILLMNLTVPLFDKLIVNKPFGYIKKGKGAK